MVTLALPARLEAKPGKEQDVANFIKSAKPLAEQEPKTVNGFALQMGPSTFGIFHTFQVEEGRGAHLGCEIAKALMAHASELPDQPPQIEIVDLLAVKKPHSYYFRTPANATHLNCFILLCLFAMPPSAVKGIQTIISDIRTHEETNQN